MSFKYVSLPELAWDFLLRASIFGHLNRPDEAEAVLKQLFQKKPDFPGKTHLYMNLLNLNEELLSIISQGLKLAGLPVLKVA